MRHFWLYCMDDGKKPMAFGPLSFVISSQRDIEKMFNKRRFLISRERIH